MGNIRTCILGPGLSIYLLQLLILKLRWTSAWFLYISNILLFATPLKRFRHGYVVVASSQSSPIRSWAFSHSWRDYASAFWWAGATKASQHRREDPRLVPKEKETWVWLKLPGRVPPRITKLIMAIDFLTVHILCSKDDGHEMLRLQLTTDWCFSVPDLQPKIMTPMISQSQLVKSIPTESKMSFTSIFSPNIKKKMLVDVIGISYSLTP